MEALSHKAGKSNGEAKMTLLEECCKRIINQKLSSWFGIRHAKILNTVKKYEQLLATEITFLTSIERQDALECLQDLRQARLLEFDGERYSIKDELETLQKLMQMSEREKAIIRCKS